MREFEAVALPNRAMLTLVGCEGAAVPVGPAEEVEVAILALELRVTTTMLEVEPRLELLEDDRDAELLE